MSKKNRKTREKDRKLKLLHKEYKCPQCRIGVSKDDTVCPECGVEFWECQFCGAPILENTTKCPECGQNLEGEVEKGEKLPYHEEEIKRAQEQEQKMAEEKKTQVVQNIEVKLVLYTFIALFSIGFALLFCLCAHPLFYKSVIWISNIGNVSYKQEMKILGSMLLQHEGTKVERYLEKTMDDADIENGLSHIKAFFAGLILGIFIALFLLLCYCRFIGRKTRTEKDDRNTAENRNSFDNPIGLKQLEKKY
ncbi:MAG: zinc ribbon domain-containing protein [Candidatus Bathyarchaeota archaeon]